jgi:predicted lipoprotein with Yx(FWY)xxD motif
MVVSSGWAVTLIAVAVAACGGGGASATTSPKAAGGASATVGEATTPLGRTLIDSQGRTLYLFKADAGTSSACSGACATAWPPLHANGEPTVGSGANASLVGTAKRSDGTQQVTYNGHPLYLFANDQKPGDVNGQGVSAFGAAWFALTPAGSQITGQGSSSGASTSSGGGGGY